MLWHRLLLPPCGRAAIVLDEHGTTLERAQTGKHGNAERSVMALHRPNLHWGESANQKPSHETVQMLQRRRGEAWTRGRARAATVTI